MTSTDIVYGVAPVKIATIGKENIILVFSESDLGHTFVCFDSTSGSGLPNQPTDQNKPNRKNKPKNLDFFLEFFKVPICFKHESDATVRSPKHF